MKMPAPKKGSPNTERHPPPSRICRRPGVTSCTEGPTVQVSAQPACEDMAEPVPIRGVNARFRARVTGGHGWCLVATWLALSVACKFDEPRSMGFPNLTAADRVELVEPTRDDRGGRWSITDQARVQEIANAFERYREGWTVTFHTGGAPLTVTFLKGDQPLMAFGMFPRGLADFQAYGRDVPEGEVAALAQMLAVKWPPPGY